MTYNIYGGGDHVTVLRSGLPLGEGTATIRPDRNRYSMWE